MFDLNDIAIFAKVAKLESFSRAARAPGMPGHAMLDFKVDQKKGDRADDGRTRTERKVQRNDQPARSQRAKLDWPTPVSVGFIVHRIGVSICHS
jgi:hypothetical protein